ncbi:MAG: DUF2868 domain-containing protein [Verrucomicrobiota bacterium]
MPTRFPSASAPWTLEELINFEHLLRANTQSSTPTTDIPEEVLVGLTTLSKTNPENARRQAFRLWFNSKSRSLDPGKLPGATVVKSLKTAGTLIALLFFLGGISLVLGLIQRPENTVNVPLFFGATVLVQLALLLVLLVGALFRHTILRTGTLSLLQNLVRTFVSNLARRASPERREQSSQLKNDLTTLTPVLRWPIVSITQSAAIAFNLGLLLAFIASLAFTDLRFYWESTPAFAADSTLHQITRAVATPWSAWFPQASPSLEQIAATRFEPPNPFPNYPAEPWYLFLVAAIVAWGLIPRLILRILCAIAGRNALKQVAFTQRHHRDLWRHLTAIDVHADPEEPADGALVLNWNGIKLDPDHLRTHILQQLHLNPLATETIGTLPATEESELISSLHSIVIASSPPINALALVAESWNLIPARFTETHTQLRTTLDPHLPLHILLLGNPTNSTPFTPPSNEDLKVWNHYADTLKDPALHLHPFHPR